MTAPVEQSRVGSGWRVAFVLPAGITLATAPVPEDPRITLAQVPARRMACLRYSGTWSQANYAEHLGELQRWIAARALVALGEPRELRASVGEDSILIESDQPEQLLTRIRERWPCQARLVDRRFAWVAPTATNG